MGAICDGISGGNGHAVDVKDVFGHKIAELQFAVERNLGVHSSLESLQSALSYERVAKVT